MNIYLNLEEFSMNSRNSVVCNHEDKIIFILQFYDLFSICMYCRSSYFEAMFRPGGMIESSKGEVDMSRHDKGTFCRMMEFIYTGMLTTIIMKLFLYQLCLKYCLIQI